MKYCLLFGEEVRRQLYIVNGDLVTDNNVY